MMAFEFFLKKSGITFALHRILTAWNITYLKTSLQNQTKREGNEKITSL
jgi:hypothetical protein